MSAVLVTGGAGYIGSHAVKALRKAGHQVVIYDNLSAGHREAALRAGGGAAEVVEGDIGDTSRVREVLESRRIDAVMLEEVGWRPGERPLAYVCGPTRLVEAVAGQLVALGHDPARVRTERFGPTGVP